MTLKPFDRLEMQELVDLLNQYSSKYSRLKEDMSPDKELKKCKSFVELLSNEIDKRRRSAIGPYNNISNDNKRDDKKTV